MPKNFSTPPRRGLVLGTRCVGRAGQFGDGEFDALTSFAGPWLGKSDES
jgi:hypothetical protein